MKNIFAAFLATMTAVSFASEPAKKDVKPAHAAASAPAKAAKPDVTTKQDAQNVPSAVPAAPVKKDEKKAEPAKK